MELLSHGWIFSRAIVHVFDVCSLGLFICLKGGWLLCQCALWVVDMRGLSSWLLFDLRKKCFRDERLIKAEFPSCTRGGFWLLFVISSHLYFDDGAGVQSIMAISQKSSNLSVHTSPLWIPAEKSSDRISRKMKKYMDFQIQSSLISFFLLLFLSIISCIFLAVYPSMFEILLSKVEFSLYFMQELYLC